MEGASIQDIETVYRGRYGEMVRVASAIAGGIEAGREAVHDAFVASIRSRSGFRNEGTVEAWLWKAVVNSARKSRRRSGRKALTDTDPTLETAELPDEFAEVRGAIRRLPERQRTVLFLRYYGDLDYQTIAAALDIRVGTVGATLNAAHETLRQQLTEVRAHE